VKWYAYLVYAEKKYVTI